MKSIFRVGFYQFRPLFGQKQKNLDKILQALHPVVADLMVLPELALTGYYFRNRSELMTMAEDPFQSSALQSLIALCKAKNMHLVSGFAEKAGDKYFNSAVLLGPAGIIHIYRKLHLFNEEKVWFDPGDKPLRVNTISDLKIGMMICWDWAFPEVVRVLALDGAHLICHPANLVLDYCQRTMIGRAIENGLFIISANRCGADKRPQGTLKFTGRSQIIDPRGTILSRTSSNLESVSIVEIDIAKARDKKITPRNDLLLDRRPDFYKKLI